MVKVIDINNYGQKLNVFHKFIRVTTKMSVIKDFNKKLFDIDIDYTQGFYVSSINEYNFFNIWFNSASARLAIKLGILDALVEIEKVYSVEGKGTGKYIRIK